MVKKFNDKKDVYDTSFFIYIHQLKYIHELD